MNLLRVKLVRTRLGQNTGRALLEFKSKDVCDKYLQKYSDSNVIDTKEVFQSIIMKPFELKTKANAHSPKKRSSSEVFLQGLHYQCTNDELYYLATDFGDVEYVEMPTVANGS